MECQKIMACLERLSPRQYACDWDNVGLLVGRKDKEVNKIIIALDATHDVITKAVAEQVDMLITHHPMIFSSVKQINDDNFIKEKVLMLAEHGICYYAMHTNFDIVGGMAELASSPQYLNLTDATPISCEPGQTEGLGRYGKLPKPMTATEVAQYVKERFEIPFVMLYQSLDKAEKKFDKIAVLPGSGKSEMKQVKRDGYELYLTGDYTHHEGLDAVDMGMTVLDATHYGLEHIFIHFIHEYLEKEFGTDAFSIIEADTGMPVRIIQ